MAALVIVGHGGYGTAIGQALEMLMGPAEGVTYLNFTAQDDINTLAASLRQAAALYEGEVLFACDLAGGSPFRQAAMLCLERPGAMAVAGLNMAAYAEMVNNLELPAEELLELGIEVTQSTILRFPEKAPE